MWRPVAATTTINVNTASAAQVVTLTNGLAASLTIGSIAYTGTNATDFSSGTGGASKHGAGTSNDSRVMWLSGVTCRKPSVADPAIAKRANSI